jgi:hypothetical protein
MLWFVLGILLFSLVLYLLFLPLEIAINIAKNEYYVRIGGLAKVALEGHEKEFLRIKLNTLFSKFYFYPLRKRKSGAKKVEKKRVGKVNFRSNFKKGLKILKSCEIKKLIIDIDTGNCIQNAKLYPAFALLDHYNTGTFRVNFEGRVHMILHLQSRPVNILKSFINI